MRQRAISFALTTILTLAALCGVARAQDSELFPGSWQSGSAVGTTTSINASLSAIAGQYTYLCGFSIDSSATAAAVGNATVQGPLVTLNFNQPTNAVGSNPPVGQTFRTFYPCLRSSAQNTPMLVTTAAPGAGGVISVSVWGYNR